MRRTSFGLVVVGLLVAVALAVLVSPFASSSPDGLEKVAADNGLDAGVDDHALAGGPLAEYSVDGVDDGRLGTGLAGLIGVGVTFAFGVAVFAVIRRVRPPAATAPDSRSVPAQHAASAGP